MAGSAFSTEMEVVDVNPSSSGTIVVKSNLKRTNVDAIGNEVASSKNLRALPEPDIKTKAIMLTLHWHELLIKMYRIRDIRDIDLIADLSSIILTMHNKLSQECNAIGGLKNLVPDSKEICVGEVKVKAGNITAQMKIIAALYEFKYSTTEEDRKKMSTLNDILNLIVAFRSRFNEVIMGNNKISYKKTDNTIQKIQIECFGLNSSHCMVLSGCTYKPSIQSAMKNALGPMTIAINLCMTTDKAYQKPWISAFCQTFKLIPNITEIANYLKGSKQEALSILNELATISLCGITRTSNKAFIPASLLLIKARTNESYKNNFGVNADNKILESMLVCPIAELDFSGAGLYYFWNSSLNEHFTIRGNNQTTARTAREMVFHAVFGSHNEDLDFLQKMTNHEFQTRREIESQLQGRGSRAKNVQFGLIGFDYVCKLASASQTDFITAGKGQIMRQPTFSGRVTTRVEVDGEFLKELEKDMNTRAYSGHRWNLNLLSSLREVRMKIATRIKKEKSTVFETRRLYRMSRTPVAKGYGEETDFNQEFEGRYFCGQEEN